MVLDTEERILDFSTPATTMVSVVCQNPSLGALSAEELSSIVAGKMKCDVDKVKLNGAVKVADQKRVYEILSSWGYSAVWKTLKDVRDLVINYVPKYPTPVWIEHDCIIVDGETHKFVFNRTDITAEHNHYLGISVDGKAVTLGVLLNALDISGTFSKLSNAAYYRATQEAREYRDALREQAEEVYAPLKAVQWVEACKQYLTEAQARVAEFAAAGAYA
ncbi:hypothetical protein AX768_27135 [Burkholderia sp. PAMC 28687]|uniref:hypothetical protein n=1 Tax=Burkholderia sp. PAMC 28687 TaxID=1795874 RepID=UPI0007829BB6|nr:hypothetical protein [Burkholderia sp. PAMC 28687]AMM17828.1 hypothetical protein AX768_27135 [Burkholderia sp. PAMC 28687]